MDPEDHVLEERHGADDQPGSRPQSIRAQSGVLEMKEDEAWHLDKRVPISLIAAILVQSAGFFWWAATTSEKVSVLKERLDAIAPNSDRLTRVEVKVDSVQQSINRIEGLVRGQK